MRHQASNTLSAVQEPVIPIINELLRNKPGALSLGQGMVAYPPPPGAMQALQNFGSRPEHHGYGNALGYPPLLQLIEEKLSRENGIALEQGSKLMVTAGSNMAFLQIIMAICDPGDQVILPRPYYFNQEMAIRMRNCEAVCVDTDARYHLQIEAIRAAITPKTKAIVTISPNNPSGAVYSEQSLRQVNALCREYGLFHISDEAYEYFTYDGHQHFSPGSLPKASDYTISLYSLSKAYGFASWRIGYMVFPEALLPPLLKIQDTNLICPPSVTQYAAAGALETGRAYCKQHLAQLSRMRSKVIHALRDLPEGCEVSAAEGAFYFLLKLNTSLSSMLVARRLIQDHGVAVIPGVAFGLDSPCCLRVSFGMLRDDLAGETLTRLSQGIRQILQEA